MRKSICKTMAEKAGVDCGYHDVMTNSFNSYWVRDHINAYQVEETLLKERTLSNLNEFQKMLFKLITNNNKATSSDLMVLLGCKKDKLKMDLKKLRQHGLIDFKGSKKNGYYIGNN